MKGLEGQRAHIMLQNGSHGVLTVQQHGAYPLLGHTDTLTPLSTPNAFGRTARQPRPRMVYLHRPQKKKKKKVSLPQIHTFFPLVLLHPAPSTRGLRGGWWLHRGPHAQHGTRCRAEQDGSHTLTHALKAV